LQNILYTIYEGKNYVITMNDRNENIQDFSDLRSQIKSEIFRLAELADKGGDTTFSGILYTIGGVVDGRLINSFASVCIDYITFIKEVSKKSKDKVDPKKFN
jgi:hypothetical protein